VTDHYPQNVTCPGCLQTLGSHGLLPLLRDEITVRFRQAVAYALERSAFPAPERVQSNPCRTRRAPSLCGESPLTNQEALEVPMIEQQAPAPPPPRAPCQMALRA